MKALLSGLGGFLAGGLVTGVIGIGLPKIMPISQAEGAYMMGVAFFWVPLGAVIGAVLGVILRRQ